ncbi:MAG: hypothetical protein Q9208_008482 [Pyrenodesmia sp. 3 TL-2023]
MTRKIIHVGSNKSRSRTLSMRERQFTLLPDMADNHILKIAQQVSKRPGEDIPHSRMSTFLGSLRALRIEIKKGMAIVIRITVFRNIHHIRKELITREIHEHEVYHRILPVIDVEVLPPRHFLPVEGGGLVEISGKEVPGRGNNWVIAETASKIPSDQAAPRGLRNFSARQFDEREGDVVEYTTAEGYPRTEQTWVHPPELETGGRNTGQTWPMEFGNETLMNAGQEHKSTRAPDTKRSRKLMEAQPSMNQQPRTGHYT